MSPNPTIGNVLSRKRFMKKTGRGFLGNFPWRNRSDSQSAKKGKKVIAVPRRAKYGEHADDHQFQIVDFLYENGYVYKVVEMSELKKAIEEAMGSAPLKAFTSTGHIIDIIEDFINHS